MSSPIEARHLKQLAVMRGWLEGRRYYKALDAMELVRSLEVGTRKDKETPAFHHQLSVAKLVRTLSSMLDYPEATIAAAFLHDILEDHSNQWSREMLENRFGRLIADAVWTLSKKSGGIVKSYDLYFAEIAKCPISSIVKSADRSHNVQTMQGVFSLEKQSKYLADVDYRFFPMIKIARRTFHAQYPAYENLSILLRCQCQLIRTLQGTNRPPG